MRKPEEFRGHPTPFAVAQALGLYRCAGADAHDGDTVTLMMDLGFFCYCFADVRLLDIDCPEIVGEERVAGLAAHRFTLAHVLRLPLLVRTQMTRTGVEAKSFERFLGDVLLDPTPEGTGVSLAQLLFDNGHGRLRS